MECNKHHCYMLSIIIICWASMAFSVDENQNMVCLCRFFNFSISSIGECLYFKSSISSIWECLWRHGFFFQSVTLQTLDGLTVVAAGKRLFISGRFSITSKHIKGLNSWLPLSLRNNPKISSSISINFSKLVSFGFNYSFVFHLTKTKGKLLLSPIFHK